MIEIEFMKPFYTKLTGNELKIVFAYQYFSIVKDGLLYHFIPLEGKDIIVNTDTKQIENMSEIFVFQRGDKFIRMPIYQMLLISNIHDFLTPIIDNELGSNYKNTEVIITSPQVKELILEMENRNIDYYIDIALDNKDEELFNKTVEMKNELVNA